MGRRGGLGRKEGLSRRAGSARENYLHTTGLRKLPGNVWDLIVGGGNWVRAGATTDRGAKGLYPFSALLLLHDLSEEARRKGGERTGVSASRSLHRGRIGGKREGVTPSGRKGGGGELGERGS